MFKLVQKQPFHRAIYTRWGLNW